MKKVVLVLACTAAGAVAHGAEFALGVGAYEGRAAFKELRVADAEGKVVYSNDFATPDAVKDWLPAGRGVHGWHDRERQGGRIRGERPPSVARKGYSAADR